MIKSAENRSSPPTKVAKSIRDVVADVLTLGELQIGLVKADLLDGRSHLTRAFSLLAVSVTLLLASLPVALISLSFGLVAAFQLPIWIAFLVSSFIGFIVGGVLLYFGSRWFSKSLGFFRRSSEELSSNVHWIKNMVSSGCNQSEGRRN